MKLQMNLCLNEYYVNKGRYPQKHLNDLISLSQNMVNISKAPICSIKSVGEGTGQTQVIHLGNLYSGPLNSTTQSASGVQTELFQAPTSSGGARSASQNPKYS